MTLPDARFSSQSIRAAASALYAARRTLVRLEALGPEQQPETLAEGYAIQAVLADMIGATSGWKLAASGQAPQARFGLSHPLVGRLAADRGRPPGARLSCSWFKNAVVEPEIAIVVGPNVPARPAEATDQDLLDAIQAVRLAIEVPDSRFVDRDSLEAPTIVADNTWDGFWILGPVVADWRTRDLTSAGVAIVKNGVEAAVGSGGAVVGGPLGAFCWLARELPALGAALAPGDAIITGTLVWPVAVTAGDSVVADFGSLGQVQVEFDA